MALKSFTVFAGKTEFGVSKFSCKKLETGFFFKKCYDIFKSWMQAPCGPASGLESLFPIPGFRDGVLGGLTLSCQDKPYTKPMGNQKLTRAPLGSLEWRAPLGGGLICPPPPYLFSQESYRKITDGVGKLLTKQREIMSSVFMSGHYWGQHRSKKVP